MNKPRVKGHQLICADGPMSFDRGPFHGVTPPAGWGMGKITELRQDGPDALLVKCCGWWTRVEFRDGIPTSRTPYRPQDARAHGLSEGA